ncbi:MAG: hypothetical protein AAF399_07980 [Bacteroidota bacterium]
MVLFEQILTRGIIFFDEEYLDECKEFCRLRNIHYLPHIHDPRSCYFFDREKEEFRRQAVLPEQIVQMSDSIYQDQFIDLFRKYEVLFVYRNQVIQGVVHYSDYNRSAVYQDVYRKLYQLERGLLHLILEHAQLTKGDLQEFRGKRRSQHATMPLTPKDFIGGNTSLKTVLEFTRHFKLVKVREQDIHKIIALRNKIAHSDNLVNRSHTNKLKYNLSSFGQLIKGHASVEVAMRQVSNRLYFMQAITDEDFSSPVTPLDEHHF